MAGAGRGLGVGLYGAGRRACLMAYMAYMAAHRVQWQRAGAGYLFAFGRVWRPACRTWTVGLAYGLAGRTVAGRIGTYTTAIKTAYMIADTRLTRAGGYGPLPSLAHVAH